MLPHFLNCLVNKNRGFKIFMLIAFLCLFCNSYVINKHLFYIRMCGEEESKWAKCSQWVNLDEEYMGLFLYLLCKSEFLFRLNSLNSILKNYIAT